MEKTLMTQEGLEEKKKELEYLLNTKRPKVIESLKEARALGDLSENAEYDAARDEQAVVEGRIKELEQLIDTAEIIKEVKTDEVRAGASVKIEYIDTKEEETYIVVGSKEADPFENKLSIEAPLIKALLGKKVKDIVTVTSPTGKYDVKIKEII